MIEHRSAEIRHTGVSEVDADGKDLRAWLAVNGDQLLLRADDASDRYSVVVDPWIQEATLTTTDDAGRQRK